MMQEDIVMNKYRYNDLLNIAESCKTELTQATSIHTEDERLTDVLNSISSKVNMTLKILHGSANSKLPN